MASSVDPSLVSDVGSNIFTNLTSVFATSIFYGTYLVLICWSTVILCRKDGGRRTRAKLFMLSATTIMFFLATFFVASYLVMVMDCVRSVLVQGIQTPLENKMSKYQARWTRVSLMQGVLFFPQVVIGDSIVVWRAYALWGGNLKVALPSLILLCASAASSFGYFGCIVENEWPIDLPVTCNTLNISCYVLSMATNLVATVTIGYKVWQHRRTIRQLLGAHTPKTRIQKVLTLLLESGLIYLGFLIITFIPGTGSTYAGLLIEQISSAISVQLVGIYPTLVIVLVNLRYTVWDESLEDCSNPMEFSPTHDFGRSSTLQSNLPTLPDLEDVRPNTSSSSFTSVVDLCPMTSDLESISNSFLS